MKVQLGFSSSGARQNIRLEKQAGVRFLSLAL